MLQARQKDFEQDGGELPTLPDYDPMLAPRVNVVLRLESMINVGCKFGPDDLEPETWDQLIALATERQFVTSLLDQRRERKGEQGRATATARAKAGVPPPGSTLFKHSKPFVGPTS